MVEIPGEKRNRQTRSSSRTAVRTESRAPVPFGDRPSSIPARDGLWRRTAIRNNEDLSARPRCPGHRSFSLTRNRNQGIDSLSPTLPVSSAARGRHLRSKPSGSYSPKITESSQYVQKKAKKSPDGLPQARASLYHGHIDSARRDHSFPAHLEGSVLPAGWHCRAVLNRDSGPTTHHSKEVCADDGYIVDGCTATLAGVEPAGVHVRPDGVEPGSALPASPVG